MRVGFNRERTVFFEIKSIGVPDHTGRILCDARVLNLTPEEREDLLIAWRLGKIQWFKQKPQSELSAAALLKSLQICN